MQKKRGYRILFVGTSQTVGAGAARLNDTFFVRIHDSLFKHLGRPIESLNIAVSGSDSGALLYSYMREYIGYNPDLVIINFSSRDYDSERLRACLTTFLKINRSKGIRTILLKEAHSNENPEMNGHLILNHKIMDEVGGKFGVPVLNLHAFLNRPEVYRTGFLWWDWVHLTSYGQAVVAQWLWPQIVKIINQQPLNRRDAVCSRSCEV